MHGAPAVSHPVGRSHFAAAFIAFTWALSAAGVALWAVQVHATPTRIAAAACIVVAAGGIAWRSWLHSPRGTLAWNGEDWSWTAGPHAEGGAPEPVLDLQRIVLLRWRSGAGAVRWLGAERRMQPSTWDDLRRAVYSRARPGATARRPAGERTT
jgi:toxin CptA